MSKPPARTVFLRALANGILHAPEIGSVPRKANTKPNAPMRRPFRMSFPETDAIMTSPTSASVVFSAGPKASVAFAINGLKNTRRISEPRPPIMEAMTAPPRACPARPFLVMS